MGGWEKLVKFVMEGKIKGGVKEREGQSLRYREGRIYCGLGTGGIRETEEEGGEVCMVVRER